MAVWVQTRWQCWLKRLQGRQKSIFKSRHFVLVTTCCTLLIQCFQFLGALSPISGVHWLQLARQVANYWDSSGTRTPSLCLEGCTVTCCILASYYQVFDFLWLCQALPVLLILEAGGSEFYVVSADGWIIFCSVSSRDPWDLDKSCTNMRFHTFAHSSPSPPPRSSSPAPSRNASCRLCRTLAVALDDILALKQRSKLKNFDDKILFIF